MPSDLFDKNSKKRQKSDYTAQDIEVLEGLEPVRKRPGMYIGGTDENAKHHLVSEVFDNSMDEAVAGFASFISIEMHSDGSITITDDGRGIPVDPHPKYPKQSALEVILTTLHSGGKFSNKVYYTSGGLHGVGISVVNALSEELIVEVTRDGKVWQQTYSRGTVTSKLKVIGKADSKISGTKITFLPDEEIFDDGAKFRPARLYQQAKSKAYLFRGVEIRWKCDPELITGKTKVPAEDVIHFPNGLVDYVASTVNEEDSVISLPFSGEVTFPDKQGRVEWAISWVYLRDTSMLSYCNTVPTPQGGTHETGLKTALLRGLKDFGELTGNKKVGSLTVDDVTGNICGIISIFYPTPQFQGQTKDKLSNREVIKLVENAVKDHFDHFLSGNKDEAAKLLGFVVERAEERLSRRQEKEISRKSVTHRLRLPGKLADCTKQTPEGTEIFLVEGDSAGGSAKMARDRVTQAILPLRGKILNVASATKDKIFANQEIADMNLAFGCGVGESYDESKLRYEKVIIMTDADVDGAHIASLLMTYFYTFTPKLITNGHLYLAKPPLFRVTNGKESAYAHDEKEKEKLVAELSKKRKVEVSRFKGLGEMTPSQLKETTMQPGKRTLLKVVIDEESQELAAVRVEELMGKKPELRFKFITEQSEIMGDKIKEQLDIQSNKSKNMTIILGIDPGLQKTGWGVIDSFDNRMRFIACGAIHTDSKADLALRLLTLHEGIREVVELYHPDSAAIEETFVNKNPVSSLKLGHARGTLMLSVSISGIEIKEYAATMVKKSIVGVGRAEKNQVMTMVKHLLPTAKIASEDAADALAVAICHANHYHFKSYVGA